MTEDHLGTAGALLLLKDLPAEDAYQHFENARLISRVTVHRWLCGKCGKPIATAIRVGGRTLVRTRDYKYSPGLNDERTAVSARARRTLDGNRHWPAVTYDVDELAEWDTGGDVVGFDVRCRHTMATIRASDVLELTRGVAPGRPGAPTRL